MVIARNAMGIESVVWVRVIAQASAVGSVIGIVAGWFLRRITSSSWAASTSRRTATGRTSTRGRGGSRLATWFATRFATRFAQFPSTLSFRIRFRSSGSSSVAAICSLSLELLVLAWLIGVCSSWDCVSQLIRFIILARQNECLLLIVNNVRFSVPSVFHTALFKSGHQQHIAARGQNENGEARMFHRRECCYE